MGFINFSGMRDLFIFKKKELFFLIINLVIVGLFSFLIIPTWIPDASSALLIYGLPLYLIIALFIYKKISKCSEFELYRALFQLVIITEILSFLSIFLIIPYTDKPILMLLGEFVGVLSSLMWILIPSIGLIVLYYHRWKLTKVIGGLIIGIIAFFVANYFITGMSDTFFTSKTLLEIVFYGITGIFLLYTYEKTKSRFNFNNQEILSFLIFGIAMFILKVISTYINAILADTIKGVFLSGILVLSLPIFAFLFVFGILLLGYNKIFSSSV